MGDYMLDKGDVRVQDYIPMCTECDEHPATKIVVVDFRSAGQENAIGREMCCDCAEIVSERIKEGLPTSAETHPWESFRAEGYRSGDTISDSYKINRLVRMLAGYDDATWDKLRDKTKRSYQRAGETLFSQWKDFETAVKEFNPPGVL